jgi:hypothetical protein
MRTKIGLLTLLGSLVLVTVMAAPAFAEERTCRGTIGATTVDNLRVPQGATCTLKGTRVKGTVKVERRATLKASDIRVIGNVQAEGAANVNVATSTVGGSVQIVQGKNSKLNRNAVKGDVQYFENRGRSRSPATGSTATFSARRTGPGRQAAATSSRETRKTSAPASSSQRGACALAERREPARESDELIERRTIECGRPHSK